LFGLFSLFGLSGLSGLFGLFGLFGLSGLSGLFGSFGPSEIRPSMILRRRINPPKLMADKFGVSDRSKR
jgi:hypothetical protein